MLIGTSEGHVDFVETTEMENGNGKQKGKHGKFCQVMKVTCIFN